jgi:hypothetical protein
MDSIFIRAKEELFLQVHKQIDKAKLIISQSRKTVEQAKRQSDRIHSESGTYFSTPKDTTDKKPPQ